MDVSKRMEMSLDDIIKLNSAHAKKKPAASKPAPNKATSVAITNQGKLPRTPLFQGGNKQGPTRAGIIKRQAAGNTCPARQVPKSLANVRAATKKAQTGITSRIMQLRQRVANQVAARTKQQQVAPKLLNINVQAAGRGGRGGGRGTSVAGRGLTMSQRIHQQRANAKASANGVQQVATVQRGRGAGRGRGRMNLAPVLLNRTVGSGVRKARGAPLMLAKSGAAVMNQQMLDLKHEQRFLAQQQRLAAKGRLGRGSQVIMGGARIGGLDQQLHQGQITRRVGVAARQRQVNMRAPVGPRQQTIRGAPGLLPQQAMPLQQQQQRQLTQQQQQLAQQRQVLALQRQRQQLARQQQALAQQQATLELGGNLNRGGGSRMGPNIRVPIIHYQHQSQQQGQGSRGRKQQQLQQMRQEPALLRLGVSHGGMGGAAAPIQSAGQGRGGRGGRRGGRGGKW